MSRIFSENFETIFGKHLRGVRKVLGLTQIEFAKKLGITGGYISDLERGKVKNPSELLIQNIESKFRINRVWLEAGEGEMFLPSAKPEPQEPTKKADLHKKLLQEERENPGQAYAGKGDFTENELLEMTKQILQSKTPYSTILASNIKAFFRELDVEMGRLSSSAILEAKIQSLEEKYRRIEQRLEEKEQPVSRSGTTSET